jgi:15-cis-phytoene synthase
MNDLHQSYALCQRMARKSASNFYFSFLLLPRQKRRAMCALYAYLRRVDDLGDDERYGNASRSAALARLRIELDRALDGDARDPILNALADTVARYRIPREYVTAVLDGVEMDLTGRHYETFDELEEYCYRVASVVGLSCIHIWGFRGPEALEPARQCGVAFQLTNILRDLREDATRGRIYLPLEDLRRFDCSANDLGLTEGSSRLLSLVQFEAARAEELFHAAAALEPLLHRDGRRVFRAMMETYGSLLRKIQTRPENVLRRRIRISGSEKLFIAARALLGRTAPSRMESAAEIVSP